jgi:hypothetical protein
VFKDTFVFSSLVSVRTTLILSGHGRIGPSIPTPDPSSSSSSPSTRSPPWSPPPEKQLAAVGNFYAVNAVARVRISFVVDPGEIYVQPVSYVGRYGGKLEKQEDELNELYRAHERNLRQDAIH